MKGIIVLGILAVLFFTLGCTTAPQACTDEALICPDGNAVGRSGSDCKFSSCPNCTCPGDSWVLRGDTCVPKCGIPEYPGAPICNLAGMKCTPIDTNSNTQLANPASTNCVNKGGSLRIVDTAEGQIGMCTLPSGKECEEWAYFREECGD